MSESYVEYLVQRKTSSVRTVIKYWLYIVTGVSLIFGLVGYIIFLLLGLVLAVISYFFGRNSNVEFEYLFLGKDLSVDRILGRSKRKRMHEFDIGRMEILAPAGSHRLDSYVNNKKYVTYDFASNKDDAEKYCFIYEGENEVSKVYIDITEELLACFRGISPRKVFTD